MHLFPYRNEYFVAAGTLQPLEETKLFQEKGITVCGFGSESEPWFSVFSTSNTWFDALGYRNRLFTVHYTIHNPNSKLSDASLNALSLYYFETINPMMDEKDPRCTNGKLLLFLSASYYYFVNPRVTFVLQSLWV